MKKISTTTEDTAEKVGFLSGSKQHPQGKQSKNVQCREKNISNDFVEHKEAQ